MAGSAEPIHMIYNQNDEVISPEAFVRSWCQGKLLNLEVYSVPPKELRDAPTFTVREVIIVIKNGEAENIDDEEQDTRLVQMYYRYEINAGGSRQYKCFRYGKNREPPWDELALGRNFSEPIASVANGMVHKDYRVKKTSIGQARHRDLRCYRWPADDMTVFDEDAGLYTRFGVWSSPRAASIMYKIVAGELRLQEPTKAVLALEEQEETEGETTEGQEATWGESLFTTPLPLPEDGFLRWATVRQEIYREGSTFSQRIEIDNEVEDNAIEVYLRKSKPSDLWSIANSRNRPKNSPTKTNNYILYVGSITRDTRFSGSVWLQKQLPTANKNREIYGPLKEIVADQRLPRDWSKGPISRTMDDAFPNVEGTWHFLKTIYSPLGDFRKITLWGCVNSDGLIIDRMVAKRFPDPSTSNRLALGTQARRVHTQEILEEIHRHRLLSMDDTVPIVALRGAAKRGGINTRLDEQHIAFMEYCEGGDIHEIIRHYNFSNQLVPEIFIWLMFKNLVAACQHVEKFQWNHPDIKPGNIFLRSRPSNDESYRAYYQPVLGDFGILWPIDNIGSGGTEGFLAPESKDKALSEQIGEGVEYSGRMMHVFSIGLNVWSLMRKKTDGLGRPGGSQLAFLETMHTRGDPSRQPDPETEFSIYSARLESLVKKCMARDPDLRPSLATVAGTVRAAIESWQRRHPEIERRQEHELYDWERLEAIEDHPFPTDGMYSRRKHRPSSGMG